MRAAALVAGGIIAVGAYLILAATFTFSPTWVGLGMLIIAAVVGVTMVVLEGDRPGGNGRSVIPGA